MTSTRREFIRGAMVGGAATLAPWGMLDAMPPDPNSAYAKKVFLGWIPKYTGYTEYLNRIRKVILGSTDFSWLKDGDTVFLKVASNSPFPFPAVSSPMAVRATVGLLLDVAAQKGIDIKVWVGDKAGVGYVFVHPQLPYNPIIKNWWTTEQVLHYNGLRKAALCSGAEVVTFDDRDPNLGPKNEYSENFWVTLNPVLPNGMTPSWNNNLVMPSLLNEVDHIIPNKLTHYVLSMKIKRMK